MTIRGKAQGFSATFKPTSNEEPCQICGNTDGDCRTTSGSELILCMKQDHDVNGFKAIGKTKDDLWTEYLPEGAKRAKREQEPKPQAKPKEQIPDDRKDSYYQALFHQLTLSPNHREDLQRRGLSDDQIETLGARSLSSGYLVPFQDETGRYVGAQVRRDNPGDGTRYFWHSEQSNHAKHNDRGELPLAIFARAGNILSFPWPPPTGGTPKAIEHQTTPTIDRQAHDPLCLNSKNPRHTSQEWQGFESNFKNSEEIL